MSTEFYAVECYAMRIRIFYNYSIYKRIRSRRYIFSQVN